MVYELMIRSRPVAKETVSAKHEAFMKALLAVPGEWGSRGKRAPAVEEPGKEEGSLVHLKKLYPKSRRARAYYRNRGWLPDLAMCDDYFLLGFDPRKVDYESLARRAFLQYVEAFRAYFGEVLDEEVGLRDYERSRETDRDHIGRISPVCFFDRKLCSRAIGLTPSAIAKCIAGHVEKVAVVHGGVFILATSEIVSPKEADQIDRRLRALLKKSSK